MCKITINAVLREAVKVEKKFNFPFFFKGGESEPFSILWLPLSLCRSVSGVQEYNLCWRVKIVIIAKYKNYEKYFNYKERL